MIDALTMAMAWELEHDPSVVVLGEDVGVDGGVDAMRRDGTVYRGVLYAGLMLSPAGPKVLEGSGDSPRSTYEARNLLERSGPGEPVRLIGVGIHRTVVFTIPYCVVV